MNLQPSLDCHPETKNLAPEGVSRESSEGSQTEQNKNN